MGFMQQELVAWEVNAGRLGPEKVFELWWYRNVLVSKATMYPHAPKWVPDDVFNVSFAIANKTLGI